MQERYLFRAKRKDSGEWVFGGLSYCEKTGAYFITNMGKDHISYIGYHQEVDQSTICQCTGLKDKNGNLIWENDILHNGNYFVVTWNAPCARFDIVLNNSHNIPMGKWKPMICDWKNNDFKEYRKAVDYEVIGNTFDNPELLEGSHDGE